MCHNKQKSTLKQKKKHKQSSTSVVMFLVFYLETNIYKLLVFVVRQMLFGAKCFCFFFLFFFLAETYHPFISPPDGTRGRCCEQIYSRAGSCIISAVYLQ